MTTTAEARKILWIDDDSELLRNQCNYLREDGCDVEMVDDVDTAREKLRQQHNTYVGVILDVMMSPGRDMPEAVEDAGLTTGLHLLKRLLNENLVRPPQIFLFTHRVDAKAANAAATMNVGYYQKQDYPGSRIKRLAQKEFWPPEDA